MKYSLVINPCIYVYIYIYIYKYIYIYILYIFLFIYLFIYLSIYLFIYLYKMGQKPPDEVCKPLAPQDDSAEDPISSQ